MSFNINITNAAEDSSISIEVDEYESVGDILVFATEYWNKDQYAFVMKKGNKLIPASATVNDLGLKEGDNVVLVPDPQGG